MKRTTPLKTALTALALGSVVALTACGGGSGAEASDSLKLSMAMVPGAANAVVNLGIEQGFFKDEGLEPTVTVVGSAPAVLTGLQANQYDVGHADPSSILLATAGGSDLVALSGMSELNTDRVGTLLATSASGVKEFKDLAGKKVAMGAQRSFITASLLYSMKEDGVDPTSVEIVQMPQASALDAMASNQIDAAIFWEPILTKADNSGNGFVDLGNPVVAGLGEGSAVDGFWSKPDMLEKHPELADKFQKALEKTAAFIDANPDVYFENMAKSIDADLDTARKMGTLKLRASMTPENIQPHLDAMKALGWIDSSPDLNKLTEATSR